MQYRDYEVYVNNPTLSRDEQSNYTRSEVLQLGLLSSLPPAALLLMQRARRMDRKRHRLALEKDHLERVAKGYEFQSPSSKAIRLDAEYDQRLDDIRTEVESIRALQTDPNVPETVIEDRVSRLIEGTNKLLRDREQRPYDIYGHTDTGKQARTMDILMNTEEYSWNRAMAGESIDESLQRVEAASVLVEHRHAIGNVHAPKQVEDLTLSGQKFYKALEKTFNIDGKTNIEIVPSEVGTYKFKVTVDNGALKGQVLELATQQYQRDHMLLAAMNQRNFDDALVDAMSASNDYRVNGQLRYVEDEFDIVKGKNVFISPTLNDYRDKGSAKNFFSYVTNTLGKPPGLRTPAEMKADIEAQNARHLSGEGKAYGKSEDSQTNRKQLARERRWDPDKKTQVADRIANDGFYSTRRKNLRDIEKARQNRFFEKNTGLFYHLLEDEFGNERLVLLPNQVAAGKMTGPSSIPKGIVAVENIGDIFLGGSPMGKQSFGSNLVVGAGIDFIVADARERMIDMKSQGKEARKRVMKRRVSNRNIDLIAYDVVNQKKVMRANRIGGTWYQSAYGTTETLIALGENEDALGVSRDQILQLEKWGGNGVKDIIHNRNVDIVDVTRTLVEKDRHTINWYNDSQTFTYARGGGEMPKHPSLDKVQSREIMAKIDKAIKQDKVNYVLLTKNEMERIGAKATESRRAVDSEGKATKEYVLFFEEDKTQKASDGRVFRIFDGENSLVGEERNKHNIKATNLNVSREQVSNKASEKGLTMETRTFLNKALKTADVVMGETIIAKEYNTQLGEAAFKKMLGQIIKYEFKGAGAIDPSIYGMFSKTEINRGSQEIIEITRRGGKDKNLVRMADRLFARFALDRELMHGPETGNKIEKIFDRLVLYRNKHTGEITNVDFKLNKGAAQRIELVQTTRKFLVAVQQKNVEALRGMEKEIHTAIAGFKAAGKELLYTDKADAYGQYVESVAFGSKVGNKSHLQFLKLQLGFGTPEGHQVYSSYALPYLGKYLASAGPKMNMYDIASLKHMNPLMGMFYESLQKESYFNNNKSAEIAAVWNRKLNNTVIGEQGEAAKIIRKHLEDKAKSTDSLVEQLTAKTERDVLGLGKTEAEHSMADTFSGKANPYKVLQAMQRAHQENVPFEKLSDYISRELHMDNIWFDNEDALKNLKAFSTRAPITRELLGTDKIKVSGLKLSFDVPLYTTSGTTSSAKSNFILYRQINPETDLIKQNIEDLISETEHLKDHQRDTVKRIQKLRLEKLGTAGKTNVLFMANDYAKAVIQMHYMDANLQQLERLKRSGNITKEDAYLLDDSISVAKAIISKSAQLIQTDSEAKLHGKAADLGKIVPQFSANLKIQRSDYLHELVPGLDWRTAVIGREHANQMVRSHFIIGTRAAGMLNDPILAKFTQHAGDTFMADFEKDMKVKGTFLEPMVKDMMDEIKDTVGDPTRGPANLNKYKQKQLLQLRRRISHAEDMALDLAGTPNQIERKAENQRINLFSEKQDYHSIQQLRTFFSPDGLYGHVHSQLKKNPESEHMVKLWEDMKGILDQHRIANNRKFVDQGRLWEGWKGIGDRLRDKNDLSLIEESIDKAIKKTDKPAREKAEQMLAALRDIVDRTAKSEQLQPNDYKEYQKRFGQVAELMMVHENIAKGDVKKLSKRSKNIPSQLDKKKDIIKRYSKTVAKDLMGYGLLANEMHSMMSFNTDDEIERIAGLTDHQIETEAKEKTAKLIERADRINAKLLSTAESDVKAKQMAERMSLFISTLKGQSEETGFAKELSYVMKGIRGLRIGMTALGKADPDIYGTKHMQYFTLKMLLEKDITGQKGLSKETTGAALASLRTGKMFVSHVAAQLLDRDFDGDAMNVYASIIDQRFGLKKGNLSVHNVVSYMNDFSFTLENGRFLPTNATAAVKSELLFNEKINAGNVSMETAHSYIRKRMAMESASVGFLDKDPGGTFDMEKMIREAEDMWLDKNHGKKLRTDIERQHLLTNTYVVSEVSGLVKAAQKTMITYGNDVKVEVHGSTREAMGLEAYAQKIANKYGLNISANKDNINSVVAEAKKMAERAQNLLGSEQHTPSEFTNRLIRLRDLDLKNQRNLMVQKTATGELYKYPTLLRTIADTVIKEGGSAEVREVGHVMAELAQMGSYSMQEKIAIGMKKGGVDAVQGVNELFKEMFSLVHIEDKKLRDQKLNSLYERISKDGLKARLTETEEEVMRKSGYLTFRTGSAKAPEMKHMSSTEVLNFGYTKQAALESMIANDRSILDKHLEKYYPQRNGLNTFADSLVKTLNEEASRQKAVVGGGGSMKEVYDFMLREQVSTNTSMAENHKAVVRFSEMGFHSVSNLLQRAHATHELPQVRQMLNIVGSTLSSEGQVLLPEQFRKAVAQNKSQGLKTNILESMLHFIEHNESKTSDSLTDLLFSGKGGHKINYSSLDRVAPSLLGKSFSTRAMGLGLGLLGLGAFAPSPAVGRNPNSVVDKQDEYSTVLPEKMLAQYSNQANITQVNPWVQNRLKQEKAESARFNHMFYRTVTG